MLSVDVSYLSYRDKTTYTRYFMDNCRGHKISILSDADRIRQKCPQTCLNLPKNSYQDYHVKCRFVVSYHAPYCLGLSYRL